MEGKGANMERLNSKRLQELSDEEGDGRLIVLPCKVGDTLYLTHFDQKGYGWITDSICSGIHISDKVTRYHRDKPLAYLVARNGYC